MDNFNYKKYLKNNPLLAEEKRVGKYTWSFMSDDERMDALLSVVKDPDEAVKYIELDWDDLPSRINPQNMRIFKEEEVKEGKRLFHYTIPKNEFGMTRMVIKAKDREEADEKIAAEYPDGGYEYKGKGAKFQYESLDEIELKYRSEDYIFDYIANDLFREKYGRTISFDELTDDEKDRVENSYDSYVDEDEPSGFYDKGMGVDESINEGSLDNIFGGIPYKTVGTKSFTAAYIPDDVKTRIIMRAKEAGKIAKPNASSGVTVFE
tara:strand:+ start:270 stop:1061 length:792 start_codon:yes stop_codon:yes gene_type:complete